MSYEGSLNNEVQLGASSSAAAKHLEAVPEEMGTNVGQQPTFHIPDSNASDVAPSDCSSYYKKGNFPLIR